MSQKGWLTTSQQRLHFYSKQQRKIATSPFLFTLHIFWARYDTLSHDRESQLLLEQATSVSGSLLYTPLQQLIIPLLRIENCLWLF
ncbi:hypothetical protein [Tolypothrix sp. NIES-4075]|uniref:hypothetical protein n=1 Tax=Tolypothrix sp. NIES-4075 TaxID=2005459 RepID=UPI00117FCB7B|nr:hypothetical protein [Tolypothrix sp. NIES-4075]